MAKKSGQPESAKITPEGWLATTKELFLADYKKSEERLQEHLGLMTKPKELTYLITSLAQYGEAVFYDAHLLWNRTVLRDAAKRDDITPEQMLSALKQRVELAERKLMEIPVYRHNSSSLLRHFSNLCEAEVLCEFRQYCLGVISTYPK